MASKAKRDSFEDTMRRLEETVAKLEEGGLPLEEALDLYEEGMRLVQACQEQMDQAELRVTRLQAAFTQCREQELAEGAREEESTYEPAGDEDEPLAEG